MDTPSTIQGCFQAQLSASHRQGAALSEECPNTIFHRFTSTAPCRLAPGARPSFLRGRLLSQAFS